MTSCEFLNVAHAALVEEFQRPRLIQGVMVPGLSLTDALKTAEPWSEGYREGEDEDEEEPDFSVLRNRARPVVSTKRPPPQSEEDVAAQNDAALQQLEGKMGGLLGEFFRQ